MRQERMTPNRAPEGYPDLDMIDELAAELLRALTPHAGNPDAVTATLFSYLDAVGSGVLAAACMKAVQLTFADCLTPTPLDQAPPGALALIAPEGEAA